MKKLIFLAIVVLSTMAVGAQTLDKFFEKYSNDERFSYVNVGENMVNVAKSFIGNDEKNNFPKINAVKVLSLEDNSDENLKKSIVAELKVILENNHYVKTVESRDKGEVANIYSRSEKNITETVILTIEKKEISIVWTKNKESKKEKNKIVSDNAVIQSDSMSFNN